MYSDKSALNAELATLQEAESAAFALLEEEREKEALAGLHAPHPIGTRMVPKYPALRSKTVGIIEPVTRSTEFRSNISKYTKPEVGSFIIRLLNNDGTPSRDFTLEFHRWKPE